MSNIPFQDILSEKYFNKAIKVKVFISGKSVSPYTVPKTVEIKCLGDRDKNCKGEKRCNLKNEVVDLSKNKTDLLKFIAVSENKFSKIISTILKRSCSIGFEVKEVVNVERIFITAPTGKERIKNVGNHVCYSIGAGIDVNTTYELDGFSTVDPNTQEGTCIFTKASKLKSDVDTFNLTNRIKNELNEFEVRKPTVENIMCHLHDIYNYYAHNITHIYNRFALHLCVDLVFRSVISFKFGNDQVSKGWLDVMVIGDTRCGKGYVGEKLVKYFNVGETVSGDNASYSGLVGGIDKFGDHKVVSWGKIPINDGGLVIIDEAGELKSTDWTRLSRVRSEGVAEIVKIHKQITNARTRLIFLANPPLKTISSYSYGIQSLMDVVKAPEDVARFDYALVVSHDEVTVDEINRPRSEVSPLYSQKLEQDLILWAWSRKPNEIVFSEKAVDAIYKSSKELAKDYSFSIPLIQGENIRMKLSKLAVCFAARVYGNKEDGKILYVQKVHVDCAMVFLNLIYKQESCGYYQLSRLQRVIDVGANKEDLDKIKQYFSAYTNSQPKLLKVLLNTNIISTRDLMEQVNVMPASANEIISKLIDLNLITKTSAGSYSKNPAFTKWLKKNILGDVKIFRPGGSHDDV